MTTAPSMSSPLVVVSWQLFSSFGACSLIVVLPVCRSFLNSPRNSLHCCSTFSAITTNCWRISCPTKDRKTSCVHDGMRRVNTRSTGQ